MKSILISQRLVGNKDYPEVREALDVQWGRFLTSCGLMPIPVAMHVPVENYFAQFEVAGVLLTGGNDLSVLAPTDPLSVERDRIERRLLDVALKQNAPVIGVCRGMQMLAHYFGGILEKKSGHVGGIHKVQFQSQARMTGYYDQVSLLDVNSYHNYCVTRLPDETRAVAIHSDKTIEAFEHKNHSVYGLMWHPERCEPFLAQDIQFFKKVFLKS